LIDRFATPQGSTHMAALGLNQ